MSESYQRGSIRKVKRAKGRQVWEWRYRVRGVMKQQTFDAAEFPTQKALWAHLATRIRLLNEGDTMPVPQAATMAQLITKYVEEYLPQLAKSTQDTDGSMLQRHFEPRWGETLVADVHPEDVEGWIKGLVREDGEPMSGASKGRARRLMKQLVDRAMFWRMLPLGENPIKLVKVRGVTKRKKAIVILSSEQVNRLIAALPQPYSLMVLVAASLGLRVEELIPLKWADFDLEERTVTISRAYTHAALSDTKTDASAATLPIEGALLEALETLNVTGAVRSEWLFPSPVTGGCMSADSALANYVKPTALSLGLPKVGWHTFRHSYKSWHGSGAATLSELKDIMRHADMSTTTDVYGGTPVEVMRPHIAAVASQLRYQPGALQ